MESSSVVDKCLALYETADIRIVEMVEKNDMVENARMNATSTAKTSAASFLR